MGGIGGGGRLGGPAVAVTPTAVSGDGVSIGVSTSVEPSSVT